MHPFEQSGLGKAPFRFVGATYEVGPIRTETKDGTTVEIGAPGQPMGTCQHCGQGIALCCHIEDAEGRRSVVGSTCVNKTADKGLETATKRGTRAIRREQQRKRDTARISAAQQALADYPATFEAEPHPNPWRAEKGDTLADYCEWMFRNAGNAGKIRTCRLIEKRLAA